jgi:hypothetical protein
VADLSGPCLLLSPGSSLGPGRHTTSTCMDARHTTKLARMLSKRNKQPLQVQGNNWTQPPREANSSCSRLPVSKPVSHLVVWDSTRRAVPAHFPGKQAPAWHCNNAMVTILANLPPSPTGGCIRKPDGAPGHLWPHTPSPLDAQAAHTSASAWRSASRTCLDSWSRLTKTPCRPLGTRCGRGMRARGSDENVIASYT